MSTEQLAKNTPAVLTCHREKWATFGISLRTNFVTLTALDQARKDAWLGWQAGIWHETWDARGFPGEKQWSMVTEIRRGSSNAMHATPSIHVLHYIHSYLVGHVHGIYGINIWACFADVFKYVNGISCSREKWYKRSTKNSAKVLQHSA